VLVSSILKYFHFECEIADEGAQAVDYALKRKPDFILLAEDERLRGGERAP
jgi:DNA-binding response OmpR family regulator